MSALPGAFRRVSLRRRREGRSRDAAAPGAADPAVAESPPVEIAPNDPILAYFQSASGAVDIDTLELESPARDALREAGVKLVVPLVAQGELIGLLNLGPRLSEQEYSTDDRKLLANLAGQAAPALRVGQLVRQQQAEARSRERIEQELRVATLIQQQFLPQELPELGGWQAAAYYRPAREVGGDFYDFIELPDGRVGIVVGDVTDKGVPAALVMATTRTILRSDAPRLVDPGKVLERANDLLVPDIPAQMFVTCLYGVLEPATGRFVYANAGHNVPYVATEEGVSEFKARGMPLGLMEGMEYEEKEATLNPGETILLHSDGLAEAHNEQREMFGFPRLIKLMEKATGGQKIIDLLLTELDRFTGAGAEQEDDITLVALTRAGTSGSFGHETAAEETAGEETLDDFTLPSELGNERAAMDRVGETAAGVGLSGGRLERLKTAVAEATMNA
ncbi:MAG TPA: SpoIIE family protein phosphatase, partial [Actinomycetota bacterium]|nr:SpoIIE family protein phosphatase [Actinomycetota bacterium]